MRSCRSNAANATWSTNPGGCCSWASRKFFVPKIAPPGQFFHARQTTPPRSSQVQPIKQPCHGNNAATNWTHVAVVGRTSFRPGRQALLGGPYRGSRFGEKTFRPKISTRLDSRAERSAQVLAAELPGPEPLTQSIDTAIYFPQHRSLTVPLTGPQVSLSGLSLGLIRLRRRRLPRMRSIAARIVPRRARGGSLSFRPRR
jgi:hypothetical protein